MPASGPGVGETTVTPTRPPGVAPHGCDLQGLMSPECQRCLSWVRAFDDERRQPTRPHPAVHQTAVKPARAVTNSNDGRPTHQAHCPFSGLLGLPPLRPARCCLPTP